MRLLLLLAVTAPMWAQFGAARQVVNGNGAPNAAQCASANNVGMVYARKNGEAAFSTFYVCGNTAAGTYAWELMGSGGGTGAANVTATSVGAVTSLAIDVSSLGLSDVNSVLVQCWSGASAPYSPVSITSLNPASTSSITANFSSTANVTCRANASGGGGGGGTGDVVGPASSTDNAIARYDSTTGKLLQNSAVTVDDSGNIVTAGSITSGSGGGAAGYIELGQGTAPTAGTTSVKLYGGSAITSYIMRVPSAAGTGFLLGTNTAGDVVQTFIGFTGTGDVVRTTGAQTAGRCVEIDASGNHIAASGACGGTGVNRQMTLVVVDPSSTGTKSCSVVEVAGTIVAAHLISNALPTGANLVVDVLKVAYASYTGVGSASSITASAVPTIATGDANPRYEDTTLTGWTTSVSANDVVCVAINTAPSGGATWASLTLEVQ